MVFILICFATYMERECMRYRQPIQIVYWIDLAQEQIVKPGLRAV